MPLVKEIIQPVFAGWMPLNKQCQTAGMCKPGEHEQERRHHGVTVQPAVTGRWYDSESITGDQQQAAGTA